MSNKDNPERTPDVQSGLKNNIEVRCRASSPDTKLHTDSQVSRIVNQVAVSEGDTAHKKANAGFADTTSIGCAEGAASARNSLSRTPDPITKVTGDADGRVPSSVCHKSSGQGRTNLRRSNSDKPSLKPLTVPVEVGRSISVPPSPTPNSRHQPPLSKDDILHASEKSKVVTQALSLPKSHVDSMGESGEPSLKVSPKPNGTGEQSPKVSPKLNKTGEGSPKVMVSPKANRVPCHVPVQPSETHLSSVSSPNQKQCDGKKPEGNKDEDPSPDVRVMMSSCLIEPELPASTRLELCVVSSSANSVACSSDSDSHESSKGGFGLGDIDSALRVQFLTASGARERRDSGGCLSLNQSHMMPKSVSFHSGTSLPAERKICSGELDSFSLFCWGSSLHPKLDTKSRGIKDPNCFDIDDSCY